MTKMAQNARVPPLADIEDPVRRCRIAVAAGAVIDALVVTKPGGGSTGLLIAPGAEINAGCGAGR